jgi:hypothetical protein
MICHGGDEDGLENCVYAAHLHGNHLPVKVAKVA